MRPVELYGNIQPTPTLNEFKSSTPTTPELAVCFIRTKIVFLHSF